MDLKKLEAAGINTSELMQTLMDSEDVLKVVLDKFLEDKNFSELERIFSNDGVDIDYKAVELYAHTLKGASGTLEMTCLQSCLQALVDDVRAGRYDKLKEDFILVSVEYNSIIKAILDWKATEEIS
ncbi:MAG: Hpt domain-containing protein [Lachnospiraceae bacterium]|nr:Hpt domain-containing protein [Lachnospiraceae bacterium]